MKQFFAIAALSAALSAPLAAQNDATVYIGHGINGTDIGLAEELPVDVTVNGAVLLAGFEFRTFTDGLALPAGNYSVQIGVADPVTPGSQPALIDVTVPIAAGENVTILAHLDDMGGLTASKFVNDTVVPGNLRGNLSASHTAWAPAVDIQLTRLFNGSGGTVSGAPNGATAAGSLRAGVFRINLFAAGTTTRVLGPAYVAVLPQSTTALYVVGSLSNSTLEVLGLNY